MSHNIHYQIECALKSISPEKEQFHRLKFNLSVIKSKIYEKMISDAKKIMMKNKIHGGILINAIRNNVIEGSYPQEFTDIVSKIIAYRIEKDMKTLEDNVDKLSKLIGKDANTRGTEFEQRALDFVVDNPQLFIDEDYTILTNIIINDSNELDIIFVNIVDNYIDKVYAIIECKTRYNDAGISFIGHQTGFEKRMNMTEDIKVAIDDETYIFSKDAFKFMKTDGYYMKNFYFVIGKAEDENYTLSSRDEAIIIHILANNYNIFNYNDFLHFIETHNRLKSRGTIDKMYGYIKKKISPFNTSDLVKLYTKNNLRRQIITI